MAKNIIPFSDIHKFRRIKGLPGHPDVKTKDLYKYWIFGYGYIKS